MIAREVRRERNHRSGARPTDDDMEIAWHLHSTFIYALIRRYVVGNRTLTDVERHVEIVVDRFMDGAVRR